MVAAMLVRVLGATAAASDGMVVSVSHCDYVRSYGGVQNVIGDEERAFRGAGWAYLNISPAAPLPILADPTAATDFRALLRLNGERLGVATLPIFLPRSPQCGRKARRFEYVVHHLMGHAPELVLELIRVTGAVYPVVWTHDFFTLCPSYTLLRNDVAFCGGPPPNSPPCEICCYGTERKHHLGRMRSCFEAACPSFWHRPR